MQSEFCEPTECDAILRLVSTINEIMFLFYNGIIHFQQGNRKLIFATAKQK